MQTIDNGGPAAGTQRRRRRPARQKPRRDSVAEDGITGVSQLGEEVAKALGVAAERVFSVAQAHLSKAPTLVQLKVGGMGLTLFDGPLLLESQAYATVQEWETDSASSGTKRVSIYFRKDCPNARKYPRGISFECIGNEAQEICELMTAHATSVAVARRDQKKAAPSNLSQGLSDSEDSGPDDDSVDTDEWWEEEMRKKQDSLNLIEEPSVHRLLTGKHDRTVHFSGEVTAIKKDNQQYVAIVSESSIYFMEHPGPPVAKLADWVCKSRVKLRRLMCLVLSEAIDDQVMLKTKTRDGTEIRRFVAVCDERREHFVLTLSTLFRKVTGHELEVEDTQESFGKAAPLSIAGNSFSMETYQDRNVTREHPAAELTFTLIMGLKGTVASTRRPGRGEQAHDYSKVDKKSFPAAGSQSTLGHEYRDFEFTVYAPEVFEHLRKFVGVEVKLALPSSRHLTPTPTSAHRRRHTPATCAYQLHWSEG